MAQEWRGATSQRERERTFSVIKHRFQFFSIRAFLVCEVICVQLIQTRIFLDKTIAMLCSIFSASLHGKLSRRNPILDVDLYYVNCRKRAKEEGAGNKGPWCPVFLILYVGVAPWMVGLRIASKDFAQSLRIRLVHDVVVVCVCHFFRSRWTTPSLTPFI